MSARNPRHVGRRAKASAGLVLEHRWWEAENILVVLGQ